MTRSRSAEDIPKIFPIREGMLLKNQICTTGTARSMCAILSRLTLEVVTSTPQRSHTIPLCLIFLYFPQAHSQSRVGPKIFSQNRPPFSGLNVRYLLVSGFLISPRDHLFRMTSSEAM